MIRRQFTWVLIGIALLPYAPLFVVYDRAKYSGSFRESLSRIYEFYRCLFSGGVL